MIPTMASLLWGSAVYLTTWPNHVAANAENDATMSVSSTSGANAAWKAHDGNNATGWVSSGVGAGQWIKVQFQTARLVTACTIRFGNSSGFFFNGLLEGSNDGSSWTQIGDNINAASSVSLTVSVNNITPAVYTYYRISSTFIQDDFAADTAMRAEEWSFTFAAS